LARTEFNQGKSAIKALEMAARGIPVIASNFGPYPEFIVDGVTGFLVKTAKQWRDRIRELVADEDLRRSMGEKARELAAGHTIEGNWHRWADAYRSLL
jgi:glycosyltransferase involved in cell wall biosynthesis